MEILGIKFAPLCVPFRRRLETLSVAWCIILAFSSLSSPILLVIYLLAFTRLWWVTALYLLWMFFDKEICERGGRRVEWIRSLCWWSYFREYFPIRIAKLPDVNLDPSKNYLFAIFPHGSLCFGTVAAFFTNGSGFNELFPNHKPKFATIHAHYILPFFRELALALGGISCRAKSLEYVLTTGSGGQGIALVPGGIDEPKYAYLYPGEYKIVLEVRKGFVKMAIKTGAPLIPTISFGETDVFKPAESRIVQRFRGWLKNRSGNDPPLFCYGRGFFQYSFGLLPHRHPITLLVGKPMEFEKVENPSRELVAEMHAKFKVALVNLFEENKHIYLTDSENKHLDIVC